MKRTASARKSSRARGTSTRRRNLAAAARRFAVCVRNDGYEASLERNKIYTVLADDEAEREGDLRVIDESGEDYLFAADRFVAIEVPAAVRASLLKTAQERPSRRTRIDTFEQQKSFQAGAWTGLTCRRTPRKNLQAKRPQAASGHLDRVR